MALLLARGASAGAVLALVLVAVGCNARRVGVAAPELAGSGWLQAPEGSVGPEIAGRWVLVEFFAPT